MWQCPLPVLVQRAANGQGASIEDVSINHRRFHILVSEQFLHRADIIAVLQQVGGEAVAESVAGDALVSPRLTGRSLDRLLQAALV